MDYINKILGGKPAQAPVQVEDSDFADFAAAPAPEPVSIPSSPADAQAAVPTASNPYSRNAPVVYTKWYRVWERTTLEDFTLEMYLIPFVFLALAVHYFGTRRNKRKARKWMAVHAPLLETEFALVGLVNTPKITPYPEGIQNAGLLETSNKLTADKLDDDYLKVKSAFEFETYASGRLNVAFADFKLTLWKWYNPFMLIAENIAGLFIESMKPLSERVEVVVYPFDGNEKNFTAPSAPDSDEKPKAIPNSSYDNFIFAVVNKMSMRKLRDDRYDLSLTFTKDNPKLPDWATVMSESAEVTDTLLTKDLIAAIEKAGDDLEYIIVTDQPLEKPTTLEESVPKKKIQLCTKLPSNDDYSGLLPLVQAFLRLPDHLAAAAHFRPEVKKKVNAIRESEKSKLKKVKEQEVEEERKTMADKLRKEERDRKMKGLSAEDQRKFLEKEAAKDRKKQEKKMTKRG